MSHEEDKIKHSRRIHADETKVQKQVKILKHYTSHGEPVNQLIKEPHRLAKKHALNCGDPKCAMCGNPRKFFKERTIQEKRFEQKEINTLTDD